MTKLSAAETQVLEGTKAIARKSGYGWFPVDRTHRICRVDPEVRGKALMSLWRKGFLETRDGGEIRVELAAFEPGEAERIVRRRERELADARRELEFPETPSWFERADPVERNCWIEWVMAMDAGREEAKARKRLQLAVTVRDFLRERERMRAGEISVEEFAALPVVVS